MTVNKNSSPLSLATYHFAQTDLISTAANIYILSIFGKYHYLNLGARSLLTVAGCGALGGSLATSIAVSKDESYYAAGANGIGAALLTFHAFKTPKLFSQMRFLRLMPLGWVALSLAYGIKFNDQGLLAGAAGGYAAFLLGIW